MDKQQLLEKHGKVYEAGTVLFREGERGNKLWVINDGRVRLSKLVDKLETTLETLGPGDFCGELALLMDTVEPVTATVVESARLLVVEASQFEVMVRSNNEIAMRMLRKLAGRLTEAHFKLSNFQLRSNLARLMLQLRWELIRAKDQHSAKLPDDLANAIGIDELELNKMFEKLKEKNLVTIDSNRNFRVLNATEFENFLSYLELKDRYEYFDA